MHFAAKRSIIVPAPNGYFLYCITTVMIVKKISAREGLFSMLTNYHTHTTRCGHAEGTEEEYILTALRCGYKVLGFSDHTPWAYATPGFVSHIRMLPAQLDDYVLTLRSLREKYADRLHLHIGLEAEYFPAYLGWLKEETERLGIEYLILGCHYDTTDEQDAKARRFGGSASPAHGRRYAEQVERALETGLYRYLAHPDLFLNRVTAFDADAEKACRDICAAAARLDIPLEYNMAGLTLQDRPDGGFQIGQAARPAQIAQIVNGKDLRHAVTQRAKRLIGFVDTHPFTAAVDRAHDKQTLAQRCAVGIDQKQFPVREFLAQLPRGNLTRGI